MRDLNPNSPNKKEYDMLLSYKTFGYDTMQLI